MEKCLKVQAEMCLKSFSVICFPEMADELTASQKQVEVLQSRVSTSEDQIQTRLSATEDQVQSLLIRVSTSEDQVGNLETESEGN